MFDPPWDSDPRERDEGSRDLSRGSRGGSSDPRERDRPDPRDVFVEHVDLPRCRDREHVHHHGHRHTLRGSESRTLSSVGAFLVIPANDLRDTFDKPLDPHHGELGHLREAGLVQAVRIDRDTTVVTLTREGRDLGFAERQARFLTTAMLYTGVCVPRQYARYCRIVHGHRTRKFFATLVRRSYAAMYDCRHDRTQLYHLNKRSLTVPSGRPPAGFSDRCR